MVEEKAMSFDDISVISNRRHISLLTEDILYIQLSGRQSIIHFSDGRTYETYATIHELESMLGSGFIRADRATLVSIKGIHDIGKEIELVNGETLYYSCRKKRELKEQLRAGRRQIAQSLSDSDAPTTQEEYQRTVPAMTARPLRLPTSRWCSTRSVPLWTGSSATVTRHWLKSKKRRCSSAIHSFGSIFPNMDEKWLRVYERTALR